MTETVSIVIVSHSRSVADGTREMVRQMVGDEVKVIACGGNPAGGLGTDVGQIVQALKDAYTPKGVVVCVDLGGAETNSEMAIELMDEHMQKNILICDAAIVEGAIMAATEASSGSSLQSVKQAAEDYGS